MTRQDAEAIITQYTKPIFGFALKRCRCLQDAEDLSQEILYELLKSAGNLRDGGAFYGFMWAVCGIICTYSAARLSAWELHTRNRKEAKGYGQVC